MGDSWQSKSLFFICIWLMLSLGACSRYADIPPEEVEYISWTGLSPFERPVWSPDGTRLALKEWSLPGLGKARLAIYTFADEQLHLLTYTSGYFTSLSWSTDSSKLVVAKVDERGYGSQIEIVDLNSEQVTMIGSGAAGAAWAPDGQVIAIFVAPNSNTTSNQFAINLVRADGKLLKTIPLQIKIAPISQSPTAIPPTLAPGQLFFIPSYPPEYNFDGMSWSPDGQQIAFSLSHHSSEGGLAGDLYIVNVDTGELRQMTFEGWNYEPAWSPSGNMIAYIKDVKSRLGGRLYVMKPNGSCSSALSDMPFVEGISWSPDGSRIVYESGNGIYILNVAKKLASSSTQFGSCS